MADRVYRDIKQGQTYHGYCCDGFVWEVAMVSQQDYRLTQSDDSIWGACQNPDCPEFDKDHMERYGFDHYRGVGNPSREDFEMWLDALEAVSNG